MSALQVSHIMRYTNRRIV